MSAVPSPFSSDDTPNRDPQIAPVVRNIYKWNVQVFDGNGNQAWIMVKTSVDSRLSVVRTVRHHYSDIDVTCGLIQQVPFE